VRREKKSWLASLCDPALIPVVLSREQFDEVGAGGKGGDMEVNPLRAALMKVSSLEPLRVRSLLGKYGGKRRIAIADSSAVESRMCVPFSLPVTAFSPRARSFAWMR